MATPPRARATIADVARAAGVSVGSASMALRAPHAVRAATREAVEQAARALGYVPDGRARALATGRSLMIGVVLPTIGNPVYAQFAHVLQRHLRAHGYTLAVQAHEYDREAEIAQVTALAERGVDGLVLLGTDHDPAVYEQLQRLQVPVVFAWSSDEAPANDCIGFSNRLAITEVVDHLLALGHRRLGVISGAVSGNERARARLAGISARLAAAGLPAPAVSFQPFSIAGGCAGLAELLSAPARPTAIICATDLMAAGALAQARERRIAVPRQLSITGFDDIDLAAMTMPALTTVAIPIEAMGQAVVETLVARIAGAGPQPARTLPTHLVIRGSTAPPA